MPQNRCLSNTLALTPLCQAELLGLQGASVSKSQFLNHKSDTRVGPHTVGFGEDCVKSLYVFSDEPLAWHWGTRHETRVSVLILRTDDTHQTRPLPSFKSSRTLLEIQITISLLTVRELPSPRSP